MAGQLLLYLRGGGASGYNKSCPAMSIRFALLQNCRARLRERSVRQTKHNSLSASEKKAMLAKSFKRLFEGSLKNLLKDFYEASRALKRL